MRSLLVLALLAGCAHPAADGDASDPKGTTIPSVEEFIARGCPAHESPMQYVELAVAPLQREPLQVVAGTNATGRLVVEVCQNDPPRTLRFSGTTTWTEARGGDKPPAGLAPVVLIPSQVSVGPSTPEADFPVYVMVPQGMPSGFWYFLPNPIDWNHTGSMEGLTIEVVAPA